MPSERGQSLGTKTVIRVGWIISFSNEKRFAGKMMNIEIGYPTDHARSIDWIWFHTLPGTSWAVGGRFDDTYIKGRKRGLARIIAPEGLMKSELKAKALVEVAKNLRDAMGAEDDDDGTGIFVICVEVPNGHWAVGGKPLPLSEVINKIDDDIP